MPEEKPKPIEQLKTFINRLTLNQKIFIVSVTVAVVVAIYFIVGLANELTYGVLFTNLSPKDSGLIIEKLKEKKIPYRIEGSGSVIKVPEGNKYELRMQLAAEGFPEGGGVGFEIFDKVSLSTTDFVQNINYLRAMEGELARSISQLKEVSTAKVHITLPKQSVFVEEQEDAKASIVLKLKPGASLTSSLVPAIVHLTAQSVEGLRPENIAVIDVYGSLLSKPQKGKTDQFDELSSKQLAYQERMEREMNDNLLNLLSPIVGKDKARVNVKLMLDFNKIETKEEAVDPESSVKVSEKSETTSSQGNSGNAGIPGVGSNVAAMSGTTAGGDGKSSKAKSEKTLVNYDFTKKVTHAIKPLGEIKQVAVAVVVDNAIKVELINNKLERKSEPRSTEDLEKITKIVQAAVGFNSSRGDMIEVANLPFDTSMETVSDYQFNQQKTSDMIQQLIKYGSMVLGFLLLFIFILRPVARKFSYIIRAVISPEPGEMKLPKLDTSKIAALEDAKDEIEIEKELMEKYKVPKEAKRLHILKEKVISFAKENTNETANLIKSLMAEE